MIDSEYVLSKLGLRSGMSVTRAITAIGIRISESTDQLKAANKIIISLGAKPVSNVAMADVIAKGLVEQAVLRGAEYTPEDALVVATAKYDRLMNIMPYVFTTEDKSAGGAVNDKKALALEIFNRETGKGLTNTAIAEIIATELEISISNAQYYVTRVFAKYSK